MTDKQAEALRPYFHGLTDEQFQEEINSYPLNNISSGMNDYAVAVCVQAVEKERSGFRKTPPFGSGFGQIICDNILIGIKQLKENK